MNYKDIVTDESITTTIKNLALHNFTPTVVPTGADALAEIQKIIPPGASVMNGSSRTLEEIGYIAYLKSGKHGWNNLHEAILNEKDPVKQSILRRQSVVSDYYIGSVHAISETGEMDIVSNTGSQLPHLVFTSPNLILVVGAQKIVPTLADALRRVDDYVVPLEDERMKQAYGYGTTHSKTVILHKENPAMKRTVTVIIVKESLGF